MSREKGPTDVRDWRSIVHVCQVKRALLMLELWEVYVKGKGAN